MPEIIVKCPHCGGQLSASPEWIGQTANCPACGNPFTIAAEPQLQPAPAPNAMPQLQPAPAPNAMPQLQPAPAPNAMPYAQQGAMPYAQQAYGPQGAMPYQRPSALAALDKFTKIALVILAGVVFFALIFFILDLCLADIDSFGVFLGLSLGFWHIPMLLTGAALELLPKWGFRLAGMIVAGCGVLFGTVAIILIACLLGYGKSQVIIPGILNLLFGGAVFTLALLKDRLAK